MVLWAHNGHIGKLLPDEKIETLGKYLTDKYNKGYYPLGFEFYQGCFQARKVGITDMIPVLPLLFNTNQSTPLEEFCITDAPPKNTLSYKLGKIGEPYLFLDFSQKGFQSSRSSWLKEPQAYYDIGAAYPSHKLSEVISFSKGIIPYIYDGLIYIHNTTRAEPL